MSATNRGGTRAQDDVYPTPAWCVRRLLERVDLPHGYANAWIEPAAGDGAIIRACRDFGIRTRWKSCDVRPETRSALCSLCFETLTADWITTPWRMRDGDAVIITNPPFSSAMGFIERSLRLAPWVVMLLRLNYLEGEKRAEFWHREMADVYVLPQRPSFTGNGKTDATAYGWYVWTPERGRRTGRHEVLDLTPDDERLVRSAA